MCVGCLVNILLFLMSNILLFSKTLIPPKDHYKLASHSSFILIVFLSLSPTLCLVWFVESKSVLQVLRWSLALFVGWEKASATQVLVSSSYRCDPSMNFV